MDNNPNQQDPNTNIVPTEDTVPVTDPSVVPTQPAVPVFNEPIVAQEQNPAQITNPTQPQVENVPMPQVVTPTDQSIPTALPVTPGQQNNEQVPPDSAVPPLQQQAQPQNNPTDILGIISLVCIPTGFQLIGVILGFIGMRKAKKEGHNPILSKIGFWVNLAITILVTILMIGWILLVFVFATTTGVNQKAMDNERETDIRALHGQLEAYYVNYGNYPLLSEINSSSWRTTNLKGLDPTALQDPNGTSQQLASSPSAGAYSYQVYDINGITVCTVATKCQKYTLTATIDGQMNGTNVYTKTSLAN